MQIYLWYAMRSQTREGDGENKKRDEFLSFGLVFREVHKADYSQQVAKTLLQSHDGGN